MPIVSTKITLDSYTCIISNAEYQALGANRKANGYWCPVGPMAGRAWCLMRRADVAAVANGSPHTLTFTQGSLSAALKNLYFDKAERLNTGGTGEADAVYLAEFADVRALLERFTDAGDVSANIRSYAQNDDYLTDYDGYTWTSLVAELWAALPSGLVGSYPGLPYSPDGAPDGVRFIGVNGWAALHEVLERINCTTAYNPIAGTFSIVQLGASQALPGSLGTPLWDGEPFDGALDVPATIRVYFPIHHKNYGQERDTELTTNWVTEEAGYSIDVATGVSGVVSGTVLPLWDDLPRVLDEDNSVTNSSALSARAAERAAKWVTEHNQAANIMHRVYAGPQSSLLPGSLNKAVLWRHWGDGHVCATEVVRHSDMPRAYDDGRTLWQPRRELLLPPNIGRKGFPNYPRLPNIVQIWDGGADDGHDVSATFSKSLFPARVLRYVAGSVVALESCWLYFGPANPNPAILPNGTPYYARLCGMETDGTRKPLYLAARPDITHDIWFKAIGTFTNLESNGPTSSNCEWTSIVQETGQTWASIGFDPEELNILQQGVYQVSYTHNRTIDPVFVTLEDDNAVHWNIEAELSINPQGNTSTGTVFFFDKYYYYRYDDVYPSGTPITGQNELYLLHRKLCLTSTFFLYVEEADVPYALTAELVASFLVREDNGTNVSIFNTNPNFVLEFERIADWEP